MKSAVILRSLCLCCLIAACQSPISKEEVNVETNTPVTTAAPGSPCLFLLNFKGKFSYDCQLLENKITGNHLRELLGVRYEYLKSIWEVEVPIEIQDSVLYTQAYLQNSGGDQGAVIMIDIKRDLYSVGVLEKGKVNLYFDDSTFYPDRLKYWVEHPVQSFHQYY